MNDIDDFDDQILGAFIDGELNAGNRAAIIRAMDSDAGLRNRIYRLRRARDLVQLGFGDAVPVSGPLPRRQAYRRVFPARLVAPLAVLAIGVGAGMLGQRHLDSLAGAGVTGMATAERHRTDRILVHISRSDPALFRRALDYTERFIEAHAGSRVEVVAHAGGLDLLRDDVSPAKERVITLMQRHHNIHFLAGADSIGMLREQGIDPDIITGVNTNDEAFDHIIRRLQDGGWKYIEAETLPGA
jgi:intracellular sulfur oxidation DsrE/DsrF family protein